MAKKKSSFSHIEAQQKLEQLRTSRETFGYDLLRIFCGYGEASIARIVDGRGNDARDGRTMLQKKLLAYCPQDCGGLFEGLSLIHISRHRAAEPCAAGETVIRRRDCPIEEQTPDRRPQAQSLYCETYRPESRTKD